MKRNQIFREKNKKKRDKQGAQSAGREEALTHWLVDYPSPFSPDPAMDATAAATLAEIHVWYRHLSPRGLRQGYGPTRRGGRLDRSFNRISSFSGENLVGLFFVIAFFFVIVFFFFYSIVIQY